MSTEETEPAGKVWICPACGNRYDAPTVCTNQHEPTAALEYDLTPAEVAAEAAEETAETTADPAQAATTTVTATGIVVPATVASPEAAGSGAADLAVVSDQAKASLAAAVHGLEQALTDFKTLIGV